MTLTEGFHGSRHSCAVTKVTRTQETMSSTVSQSGFTTSSRVGSSDFLMSAVTAHVNLFVLGSLTPMTCSDWFLHSSGIWVQEYLGNLLYLPLLR